MGVYLMADSWWLDVGNLMSLAKAIFGLGIVIFVHELGHFLVAKACGVKCEKFYVGFDVPLSLGPIRFPAKLWHKQWGETEYGIGLIPLGGYVKMLGQDDNPAHASVEAERIRQRKSDPDGNSSFELDPRSYPAKSVPQRMAIISAGVIMNLIFAVIFASIAYWMGVKYEPAVCGRTVPGDSAWQNALGFGDKIVQFGRNGRRDEHYRFRDVRYHIGQAHDERKLDVLIEHPDATDEWVTLQSVIHEGENLDLPTIGLIAQSSLKLFKRSFDEWSPVAVSELEDGDVIRRVICDDESFDVADEFALRLVMMQHRDQPLTLIAERSKENAISEIQATLPPQPQRDFGFQLTMGPVVAVQQGSPAAAAGVQPGDVLRAVDGLPISDPQQVDTVLAPFIDRNVTLTLLRNGEPVDVELTPRSPTMTGEAIGMGRATSAESIGAAFAVLDEIASIRPGGPADQAGLQAGDRLKGVQVVYTESSVISEETFLRLELGKPIEIDVKQNGWAGMQASIDANTPRGLDFAFRVDRDGTEQMARVTPTDAVDAWVVDRGVWFYPQSLTRTANSFADACRLGLRETKEAAEQVLVTLKRLPKLYKHMGGPLSMAVIATMEASEGLPRLLLFLTFLSANLAVLNFMPIPVLDGGHMMFLIYEGVFGRPLPERFAFLATMMGVCFVLCLMAYVIGLDVYRLVGLAG